MHRAPDGTAYQITGDGPPVVLIHGFGLDHTMWRAQVGPLAARCRVIAYDLYGHGDSPAPPAPPSLTLFSAQLAQLLNSLKIERAAICGFSLGGMIARRFAIDHPKRTGALAILHSAHARTPEQHAAIAARVEQARAKGPAATVGPALERWFTGRFRASHPEVMDWVRQTILANDRTVYPEIYAVLVEGVDELVAPDPPIDCPALVMTGSEDHGNSPAMSAAIAAEIAGAETVILPGLRHMAMVEAPERFNPPLLSFLDRWAAR